MPKVKIRKLDNKPAGEIELSDAVFGGEVRYHLLHEAVRMQRARRRLGTASTRERNAVVGGGQKPYRQKGTGRARQGSIRAPNHVGGGVVFGPSPRSYDFRPPKRARRGAMISALSLLVKEDRIVVLENLDLPEPKTRELAGVLERLGAGHALVVDDRDNENLRLSARNLARSRFLPTEGLNVYDLLEFDRLVISKRAVLELQERLERPVRARRAAS
jgi:large subunit ribosomal protein L4